MKHLILAFYIIFFVTSSLGQDNKTIRYGLKEGLNLNQINGGVRYLESNNISDYDCNANDIGLHIGGFAEYTLPKWSRLKFQGELLYNYNVIELIYDPLNKRIEMMHLSHIRMHSIQIPLSIKYFLMPKFSINLGIDPTINLGGSLRIMDEYRGLWKNKSYQPIMFGVHIGADYYIKKGFFVAARYNNFVTDAFHQNNDQIKEHFNMRTIHVGIGYKF